MAKLRDIPSKAARALLALVIIVLVAASVEVIVAQSQVEPLSVFEIDGRSTMTLEANGNAHIVEEIKFSAQAFTLFKNAYNPLSTFLRDLKPRSAAVELRNISMSVDDANNIIRVSYLQVGAARYVGGGKWAVKMGEPGERITLSSSNGDTLVFTKVYAVGGDYKLMETITVKLPPGATNPSFDEAESTLYYHLDLEGAGSSGGTLRLAGTGLAVAGIAVVAAGLLLARRHQPPPALPQAGLGEQW